MSGQTCDLERIKELILSQEGNIFIDIGAYNGYYSTRLAKKFKKVYAFEPSPKAYRELVAATKDLKNIECFENAVGNIDGEGFLFLKGETTNSLLPHFLGHTDEKRIKIKVTTLSSFLKDKEEIDFVKVDVEGAEWMVLYGASEVMNKIKSWFIEIHAPYVNEEEVKAYLELFGYEVEFIIGNMHAKRK